MAKYSLVRKGAPPAGGGDEGNGVYLSVKADEQADVAFTTNITDMLSIQRHAFWQENGNSPMFACLGGTKNHCPGCELGDKPKYRAFMQLVQVEKGQRSEPKVFSFGIRVARALSDLDDALGGLRGHLVRIKRRGSGMNTTYSVIQLGKRVDVKGLTELDLMEHLGPLDRPGIVKLLQEANVWDGDESDADDGDESDAVIEDEVDGADETDGDEADEVEVEEITDDDEDTPKVTKKTAKTAKPPTKSAKHK